MGQGTLTNQGRAMFAQKQANEEVMIIDRFLLANIAGLDPEDPENQNEPLPAIGNRVAELPVSTQGFVNADQVVYSLYLGTEDGDFTFNWVGLLADDNTLVAVRYIDPVTKFATSGSTLGNAMTRNFLVAYVNAQAITNISVQASSWQFHHDVASEAQRGLIRLANQTATNAGLNDTDAVTPLKGAVSYVSKVNNSVVQANTRWNDNRRVEIGDSADMSIFHSGGSNFIQSDSGSLSINQQANSSNIFMRTRASGGAMSLCVSMGGAVPSVSLYHNASRRLLTTATGVQVDGSIEATGNIVLAPGGSFVDVNGLLRQQGERLYSRSLIDFIGCVFLFDTNVPPPGFLAANGAAVSRSTYANLFDRIGTRHGAGNGSTTFNLPDCRGEFLRGWDNGRGIDNSRLLGSWQDHQFQSHSHQARLPVYGSDSDRGDMYSTVSVDTTVNTTGLPNSGNYGSETRPRNLALLACICYAP